MDLREFAKKRKEDPLYGHNDRYRRYIAGQINSLNKDIDDYRSEVNSLYTKQNEREAFYGPEGEGSAGASGGRYRGDTQTNLITVDGYKRRTATKSAGIRDKLNKYGSYMTSDDVAAITSMLDDTDANIGRLYDAALEEQTVFGGYKDESDYVTKTQAFLDYLDMGEDLTARRGDIRLMDDVLDNPDKQDNYISARYAISKGAPNSQTVGYGSGDALIPSAFTVGGNMNATVNQGRKASDIAYKDALSLVTDENSEYFYKNNPYYNKIYDPNNVTSKSTDALEALRTDTWSQYAADMAGYAPVAALNDEKYAETVNIGKANNPWGEELDFLDPDIADIAYYYLGKGDEETARIVANIPENAPITAYIKGAKWANAVNDIPVIEELAKFGASAIDTVGTAGQKLYNMATQNDDVVTPTRFGYAANIAQSDDTRLKAIFGDAAISLGQMAPSAIAGLAVSAISKNPKLGANVAQTLFGVNAASGAYNEKIEAGWKPSEALTYGVLTGLSEVAVEKILGGSAKLIGGQFADDIAYGINNAVSKLAKNHSDDFMMFLAKGAKVTGSMAQEFLEESVQTVLDPAFELVSRGETDGVKFSEVLYAGLTGMITGGLGEAGSAVGSAYHGVRSAVGGVRGAIDTARVGKAVMNTEGGVGTQKTLGEGMSLDSAAHKLANKVTPDTGAYRIGKLYKTVGTQITAENRADIMKSLTRKGVDTATAGDLISAIVDVAQGKELTNAQKALIENNESAVSAAIVNIAENPMSTVNQRTDAYKNVADAVKNAKTTRAESRADSKAAETTENTAAPVASAPSKEAVLQKIPEIISRESGKAPSVLDANNADDIMTAVNAVGEGPRDIVVGDFDGSSAPAVTVNGNGRTELSSTGAPVTVAEVASVKNGKVTLKLDDGSVVDASELSYASRDDGLVYEMVSDMSPTTANTFVSDYSVKASDVTLSDYALAWKIAYEYGYRGFDEGEVYGDASVAEALLPAQARHAFAAGRADANAVRGTSRDDIKRGAAEAVKTAENAVRAKSEAKAEAEKKKAADKGGKAKLSDSDPTVKSGRETGAKDSDIELAVMLKKATGREIIFRKDKESLNGEYDGKNTVFVNPDGSDLVHTVLAHEIAHSVEGSKHYSKLVSAAKAVAEARGQKWEDILDEAWDTEARAYKDNGQTFGSTEAEYEAVAKVISSMFTEEADLRVFIEALDKPTIKVIYDAIGRVIKRLRSFLADRFKYMTDKKNYDAQYRRMQIELQRAERARAVFARALRNPGDGGKVRYLANEVENHFKADKYFKSIMDKWQDLKHGAYVKVGTIDNKHPLALVGMPEGVIRYDVDKLQRNMDDHSDYLTVTLLKTIPDIITNPVAISEYSEYGTVSVFGDIFIDKSPMMVGVTISKDRSGNDISKVRTFNTRRDVGKLITDEKVLYLDNNKKRTLDWFQACGIQVPLGGTKFGFIRSISHPDGFVNSKNQNSRHSSTQSGYGTKPKNKAEELNRIKAQEMLARGEDGDTVYNETGWFHDKFGNLVVDHEAPVYQTAPATEKILRFAEHMEAQAAEKTAEAESLREDIRRAKSAIKSDSKATTKPDREYVKGLVNELIPDPADGKYPRRVREKYTDEILALYDRRDDVDSSGVHAMSEDAFEAEIARIVFEMQAEEVTYDERIEIADRVKAELRVPMYVSDTAKGDFSVGEGYAKTRQHYMGRLDLRSDRAKGTPVDVRYMELNGAFPEWFPIDIENEADELRRIMEVADTVFDKSFTEGSIYSELPEAAYVEDAERMKQSIREGYKKLKRIPRTFSDEILQMLESRERRTEEAHKAAMEKLLRKAEWEMVHELRAKEQLLSAVAEDYDKQLADQRAYYEGREADRKKREADKKAAALKRKRDRGLFIDVEKEFAALKDGSFSSEMRKLYERQHQLVAELAPFENIDANKIENEGIREYVKETREKLDNLNAYIRRVGQIQRTLLQKSWLEVLSKHDLAKWKDKRMGLSYQVETMRRNIEDISGGDELGREILKTAIDPIDRHVAEGNKLKNALRARVEALNLDMKPKKGDILSESAFVQLYGEARDNIEMLKNGGGNAVDKNGQPMREGKTLEQWEGILNTILLENPGISGNADTMKRMDEAVKVFSEIYDQLIGMINSVRMLNGYEPVAYHHGYFPHFNNDTGADSTLVLLAKSLGIGEGELDGLPTSINGITRTFRPGIRYMANANQRSVYGIGQEYNGFRLNAGAVEGFDRYIEVAADIIYLTEDVQRLRALSNAIRYATTDKGIKERHDMIDARDDIDIAEKQSLIDTLYSGNQKYALRNFVVELEDYTNILAGKKSNADRDMEQKLGRSFYAFAKKIEGKVAANMVVMNPASWLTNFIPLTQGAAVMPTHMIISSMYDTLRAVRKGDALAASSAFLTNRRGSDMISVKSASQVPARFMEAIDMFTSETLVRARVKQNVKRGMSYADALAEADVFVSKMMAGRSKGAMPTIFHQSNPLTKLFTQFQLEVKNQWSFFTKDMPAEARNNSDTKAEFVGRMIGMMLKYAVGAWLFDELYELLVGRRPGFDPIDIVNEAVGDITGYALPGVGDMAKATFTDATWMDAVKANKVGVGEAGKKFASNVGEQVPFVGGVLFDGGRIPISSALPSMSNVWDAITNTKAAPSKRVIELAKELSKPLYYTVLSYGGSMVKKAVEGTEAIVRGGSYKLDKDGNEILQYPVYNDNAVDVAKNVATTLLSGKSATEGGREWIESGFNSLSAKETARYQALVKSGMSQRDAYEAIRLTSDPKALYDIMISGDSEQITKAKSGFKDEKAYEAALRAAITEHDPRIMEAVRLQIAGDVSGRVAIQKEIIGEGHFKMGVVTAAVNNAVTSFNGSVRSAAKAKLAGDVIEYQKIINELVNDKGYAVETVSSALGEDVAELLEAPDAVGDEETLYTASDISTAFKSGDVSGAYAAITELVSVKTANYIADGKTPEEAEKSAKSTAKSQVTKSFKEDYKAAYANGDYDEMDRIAKIIYGTGLYEYLYEVDSLTFKWQREYDEDNEQ